MTALKLNNELDVPVELADVYCTGVQLMIKCDQVSVNVNPAPHSPG